MNPAGVKMTVAPRETSAHFQRLSERRWPLLRAVCARFSGAAHPQVGAGDAGHLDAGAGFQAFALVELGGPLLAVDEHSAAAPVESAHDPALMAHQTRHIVVDVVGGV